MNAARQLSRTGVLVTLMLVYTANQVDRQLLGILLEPIRYEFKLSDSQLGFLSGIAFAMFYATLGIPFALLADRTNRRNLISIALTLWSLMTALCGVAATFAQLLIFRVGVGVGESGSLPTSQSMIADLYPREERATAMGILSIGANLGVMTAFMAGGLIAAHWGWRVAFLLFSVLGVVLALFVRLFVPEPAREGHQLVLHSPVAALGAAFSHVWRTPALRNLMIAGPLAAMVSYAFLAWLPSYLIRTFGGTTATVGPILSIVIGVGGCLGTLLGGIAADRFGKSDIRWHVWVSAIALLLAIPTYVAALLVNSFWLAIGIFLAPAFLGIVYSGPNFALIQGLFPPPMRALGAAIYLFIVNLIGLGVGPLLVGELSDHLKPQWGHQSLRWALASMAVFWLLASWFFVRTGRTLRTDLDATAQYSNVQPG
jgi:predicted MFS family arabinose efflux permease